MSNLRSSAFLGVLTVCLWPHVGVPQNNACKKKCGLYRCVEIKTDQIGDIEIWSGRLYNQTVAFDGVWCKDPPAGQEGNCADGAAATAVWVRWRDASMGVVCNNAPANEWQTGRDQGNLAGQCRAIGTTETWENCFTQCVVNPPG